MDATERLTTSPIDVEEQGDSLTENFDSVEADCKVAKCVNEVGLFVVFEEISFSDMFFSIASYLIEKLLKNDIRTLEAKLQFTKKLYRTVLQTNLMKDLKLQQKS